MRNAEALRGRWWPAALWALFILVLCLFPGPALPTWEWADLISLDKSVHAALFAVLYILVALAMDEQYAPIAPRSKSMALAFLLTLGYGAATEWMQQIPALGRRGDLLDLLANAVGAMLGLVYFRRKLVVRRDAVNEKDG